MIFGGGPEMRKQKRIFIFRYMEQFSFKKNLNNALYVAWTDYNCRKIIQNGALFTTIQLLTTFVGQNFQVFLWRDLEENNLGNYLLRVKNIIPARIFPISLYFLRIEIAIFAQFCLNFLRGLEMKIFGISVMGGWCSSHLS